MTAETEYGFVWRMLMIKCAAEGNLTRREGDIRDTIATVIVTAVIT